MMTTTIEERMATKIEVANQMNFIRKKFISRRLPAYMWEGVDRYIRHGHEPGHFLIALFSNQFLSVFAHADPENVLAIKKWAMFLNNDVPIGCIGSLDSFKRWRKDGGLTGYYTRDTAKST